MSTGRPSARAQAFWDLMRQVPQQVSLPIEERRAAGEHAEDATAEPRGVVSTDWPDHGGLRTAPAGVAGVARVLYLFGGGYMLGSPASRLKTAGHIALAAQAEVFIPGYRLAPEHPHPAGLEDALAAWEEMAETELPCFVVGDSSGGGLALALSLAASGRQPDGVVAFSPWADLTCSGGSFSDHGERDIECTQASLNQMADWYAGDADRTDPLFSPVFADPTLFPPILAFVGSEEVLLDDAARLVRAAGGAGGDATLVVGAGLQHVYPIWSGVFPEADEAIEVTGQWLRARSTASRTFRAEAGRTARGR